MRGLNFRASGLGIGRVWKLDELRLLRFDLSLFMFKAQNIQP